MDKLFDNLNICELAGGNNSINDYLDRVNNDGLSYHLSDRIKRTEEYSTDSYELSWADTGLTNEDQRILKKILRKDFKDAGRKRGAILRYIKHFKKEPDSTGLKLHQVCLNQN
tara:strand:+ start:2375 stop:2713 length:339 start_codon:yes stop_codon:yes gene_type:complete